MATTTADRRRSRIAPAVPSWRRVTVLVSLLLLGWAALLPAGRQPLWWHYAVAAAVILAFLGSWHGQHVSTTVRRWAPMAWHNRRQRSRRARGSQPRRRRSGQAAPTEQTPAAPAVSSALEARIVIHLRPHPHTMTTPEDTTDQLPWRFITSWLDRYGVRADAVTITAVTRTPAPSGLRTDSAALLTGRTPQHRDTWLTYTLRAESNVGALTARRTTMGDPAGGASVEDLDAPARAALADTTGRRLIAELRERGWLATISDVDELPEFTPGATTERRETWTATEYADGFRAVYAVEPAALDSVLAALPTLGAKTTWVTLTIRARGHQPATIEACVGTLTGGRPTRDPLPGLSGFHGLHRRVAPGLTVTGFTQEGVALPTAEVVWSQLEELPWPTGAAGVPIGFNRARQPVYLGLASPEPARITVTGTREFHVGIIARLALSGLPVAVYTADPRQWTALANHAAAQQIQIRPPAGPPPGAIVVTDGSVEAPAGAITVTLRRPQTAHAPSTTIVITQDGRRPDLFWVTTAHGRVWLSTRLVDDAGRR